MASFTLIDAPRTATPASYPPTVKRIVGTFVVYATVIASSSTWFIYQPGEGRFAYIGCAMLLVTMMLVHIGVQCVQIGAYWERCKWEADCLQVIREKQQEQA